MSFSRVHLARYTVTQHSQYAKTLAQYVAREGRYAERGDLVAPATTQHLPAWAEGSAVQYFVTASTAERVNGRYALMLTLSLPRELSEIQRQAVLQDCVTAIAPSHVALWAQHAPLASDQLPNPHGHVLLSPRLVDGMERSATETFRRWNAEQPTAGGQRKDPFWRDRQAIGHVRVAYAEVLNLHLEWAGSATRVAPWADHGQARTARVPIWDAGYTPPSPSGRDARQTQAAQWWESRKAALGIEPVIDLSRDQWTAQVHARSRALLPGTALPTAAQGQVDAYAMRQREQLAAEQSTLAGRAAQLDTHGQRLQVALLREQDRARTGARRSPAATQHVETVLAHGAALGLGDEATGTGGLTVEVDQKKQRGRGR